MEGFFAIIGSIVVVALVVLVFVGFGFIIHGILTEKP